MELKPCPFCGTRDMLSVAPAYYMFKQGKQVQCDVCYAQGPFVPDTEQLDISAEEAWNRRV